MEESGAIAARPEREGWRTRALQIAVAAPVLAYLVLALPAEREELLRADVLLFGLAVAVVDLIPVPGWGGLQLSLSFPILLGAAIVFPPPVAAAIAFVGSVDPRELRREMPALLALFNRSQMAASTLAGSILFHRLAEAEGPVGPFALGVLAAAIAAYSLNAIFVAGYHALLRGVRVAQVLRRMHGSAPYEFLVAYLGLGLFGGVIARLYLSEGFWSVAVFLGPLVFARQMYFRNRALADRLAEQNRLLAEQAVRLEELLAKEQRTVDELRELNRMKGEFVAVVSHELRTPVTALLGYAKTLRQPGFAEDPTLREEFLERMERQSERLLRLVENLLTASRIESRQLPLSLGRVLFEDIVREVLEGLAPDAARVAVRVPDDLPVLTTDRQLLSRVLQNLLDNALKYSPEASPCELEATAEDGWLVFSVRDHGIGIPAHEIPRIFERFYQVDQSSTRSFRGAGLGLSLVRDLVQHLGGGVEVESAEGEGSRFTVRIPVRHPNLDEPVPLPREVGAES
ncbi:Sensor histidine kinase WalK [bacterium HR12]|nr:Sensor histidine kinase WalK [bacterium HR12]